MKVKTTISLILFGSLLLLSQVRDTHPRTPVVLTVATLPASPATNTRATISDGASSTDCTTGSGSTIVDCRYNGSAWTAVYSGGSSPTAGPWAPFGIVGTGTNFASASANRVHIYPITLLAPISIQRAKWYVATGTASTGECGFAVYVAKADGSGSKVAEFGAACTTNSTAVSAALGGAQTINAGTYYVAYSANDTTVASTFLSLSSVFNAIPNLNSTETGRIGYCANTADFTQAAGSVFPSTCGTITESAFTAVPLMYLEPTSI